MRALAVGRLNGERFRVLFDGPGYNEFTMVTREKPEIVFERAVEHGILGGLPVNGFLPELGNASVWSVNERMVPEDLDNLSEVLEEIA
jgi:glycine dehydrogenase subunit 1